MYEPIVKYNNKFNILPRNMFTKINKWKLNFRMAICNASQLLYLLFGTKKLDNGHYW